MARRTRKDIDIDINALAINALATSYGLNVKEGAFGARTFTDTATGTFLASFDDPRMAVTWLAGFEAALRLTDWATAHE